MDRVIRWVVAVSFVALPLGGQQNSPDLVQAQQALGLADGAGARVYARSLYDDAAYRLRFAQENLDSPKPAVLEQARMRVRETVFAARAALAKARWLSTNAAARGLLADIARFGGKSDLQLPDEDVNIDYHRGPTTKDRLATAQAAIDQAKAAGAEQTVPDNDLKSAQADVESARKVSRDGRTNSDVADYLAYLGEMIARRAYYMVRFAEATSRVPDLQLQRTRLAQAASEQQAAAERARREEAERHAAELQRQLAAEQANRQAQVQEVERLRQQVEESRKAMLQRIETDRASRQAAERALDDAMRQHEAAVASGSPADIDRLRRQVEDQEITVRTIQERERLDAQAMASDLETMRTAQANPEAIARRQSELDEYQKELQADAAARADVRKRHDQAIAAAQKQRQEAEARAAAVQQQLEQARQSAAEAAQAAQAAQQQAQQQAQQMQQMQQQLAQQSQQSQAEAEKARQAAQAAQAELEKTREELARRDAEARQLRMQQELARIAATRAESRGIVVTLPGIFFDSGKWQLKPGAKSTLTKIAAQVKTDSALKITVEGHTDNVGSPAKNQDLSQKRAGAVRDYLVSQGIPADRMTATGKGETEPIATNKTVAGRQQNRRVELVIAR